MTEKLMFVGSVGPLYFDDAEKSYEDSDMLVDDVVSPLQRAIWSDGDITAPNIGGGSSDTTAPGTVTGMALVGSGMGGIEISWIPPADVDVYAYRIYGDVTSVFNITTTNVVGTVLAPTNTFTHRFTHPLSTAYTWYYWVAAVDKAGNASSVAGPLTISATSTYDNALSNIVQAIIDNTSGKITFLGDRLKVAPPPGVVATTIQPFYAGVIDGVDAVALKGDLFVDGTVNAKCLTANSIIGNKILATTTITLNEGGVLALGNSGSLSKPDVEVITNTGNGQGKLIVYDGVSNAGYNSTTEFWRSTIAHYVNTNQGTTFENPPRRMITGYCMNRSSVTIPGHFPHMPQVMCFPTHIYGATGKITCHPGALNNVGLGQWSFTMYASVAGTGTHNRAPNTETEVPYSVFTGTPLTIGLTYCREDQTSSYSFTRIVGRYTVRAQSGAGSNPTGSQISVTVYGRKSNGAEASVTNTVYADTDYRSYWFVLDTPDLLMDSIRVVATHAGTIPSRYRWPLGQGMASIRLDTITSYPSIPSSTYEVGGYLAFF